ncbi:MAG TPA: hypothetical protein VFE91_05100 [Nitrososphaerales archaeon]|nr:hypothetical protein [Nitrososphaerales archaeon]
MKTRTIAASILIAVLLTSVGAVAVAHSGVGLSNLGLGSAHDQSGTSNHNNPLIASHHSGNETGDNETSDQNNQGDQGNQTSSHQGEDDNETESDNNHVGLNLTVGTTLTIGNLTGHFVSFGNSSSHEGDDNEGATSTGNSTGAFTFKVTSSSSDGFNLTIVSGTFSANGTTYTVSGGHLTLNEDGESGSGWGNATGGATFHIHVAGIHGNTTSTAQVGAIKLDVRVGSSEYLVILGSGMQVEDQSGD